MELPGRKTKVSTAGITSSIGILLLTMVFLVSTCTPATTLPLPPVLDAPFNGATDVHIIHRLEWHESSGATSYGVQVSTTPDFATLLVNETDITCLYYDVPYELSCAGVYYWRANARNANSTSAWPSPWSFTTEAVPPPFPPPPPGEVIRLYYAVNVLAGGPNAICSATSTDGVNFTEDPGVRFAHPGYSSVTDPDVVRLNNGSWLMFGSLGTSLLKATSPVSDNNFTIDESFSWDQGGVPGSYNFNGTVKTCVCHQSGIAAATYDQETGNLSYSGLALNAPPGGGMICDPSVIEVDGQYLMFYKYEPPNGTFAEHRIYLATSSDGIAWTQHSQNRFIGMGSVPAAVYYNGLIYVYFCDFYFCGSASIPAPGDLGVFISRDKGATFTFSAIRIQGKTDRPVDPAPVVVVQEE
ncbi:MAG: hypothetical protein A2Z70_02555 [Chloroflexi bacterium RBG_13_48_17]|nr:MAG: hypothetical protein A2Z70_02555 [Chloroflexi bacterium RBG_13_48_17]